VGEIDRLLKAAASEYLDERVKEILRTRSQVCPVDDFVDLYGEMLGRARAMHLGASFRRLHDLGLTDDDAKGAKWFTRPIHWAGTPRTPNTVRWCPRWSAPARARDRLERPLLPDRVRGFHRASRLTGAWNAMGSGCSGSWCWC